MKFKLGLADVMSDPYLTVTSSPFSDKTIIKRLPYGKGTVPPQLEGRQIRKGECAGVKGKALYKGKIIPKTAICVAQKRGRG